MDSNRDNYNILAININESSIPENIKSYISQITSLLSKQILDAFDLDYGNNLNFLKEFNWFINNKSNNLGEAYLSGKVANNYFSLAGSFLSSQESYPIDTFLILLTQISVHELLHKLFNLDNRLDTKTGHNVNMYGISVKARESLVEYFTILLAPNIACKMIKNISSEDRNNYELSNEKHSVKSVREFIYEISSYREYVHNLKDFKMKFDKLNVYPKKEKVLEKLLADFFFIGSNEINIVLKKFGMPNIFEYLNNHD